MQKNKLFLYLLSNSLSSLILRIIYKVKYEQDEEKEE